MIPTKKPVFVRTDSHKKVRLGTKWRRPDGRQNKRRLRLRGYAPVVKVGYQSESLTKGLKNGLIITIVNNVLELKKLNNKHLIIVASNVGNKKRMAILSEAKKMNLQVANHPITKADEIKTLFEERVKVKKQTIKEVEEEARKKEKKSIEESVKQEDKKESEAKTKTKESKTKEKKDYDKLLTTKQ